MTVYLPSEKYELLKIDSNTGNVTIPDLFSFKNVDITASTGNIICNASVTETFNGKTSTGAVQLDKIQAENIDLNVDYNEFKKKYMGSCDGHSTEKVVKLIGEYLD